MDIDCGCPVIGGSGPEGGPPIELPQDIRNYYRERPCQISDGTDVRLIDPLFYKIEDETKLDGLFQSERMILHRLQDIKKWLKVKPEFDIYDYSDDNTCVINFRGGEWTAHPKFFLHPRYWANAVAHMRMVNSNFRFVVVTDDPPVAKQFFPNFQVIHQGIGKDYAIVKNAKYLIISNSSFAYFPTLTSETAKLIIAPRYWGRHNISDGYWSLGYNISNNYEYLDRDGSIYSYARCVADFKKYMEDKEPWKSIYGQTASF